MSDDEQLVTFTPSPTIYPFQSKWFDSPAGRVHYIDEGSGRPILFLHGNPTWSFLYRAIITRLRDHFRCIAVDYPGFGLSERPDGYGYTAEEHAGVVSALVEHLGLEDLIVMGQDWGGPIGISVALTAPERVTGLVFGNSWFWPTDRLMNTVFSLIMSSPPMRWMVLERNFFVERMIPTGTTRQLSQEEMDHYRGVQPNRSARLGVAEFPRQLRAAGPWLKELADAVPATLGKKPLLLVWGMKDWCFHTSYLQEFQQRFPNAETFEIPDAGHYLFEDAHERIIPRVREFLDSNPL